jgi:hypothetical protein
MNAILTRWSRPGSFVLARYSDDPALKPDMMDRIGVWETAHARVCAVEVMLEWGGTHAFYVVDAQDIE